MHPRFGEIRHGPLRGERRGCSTQRGYSGHKAGAEDGQKFLHLETAIFVVFLFFKYFLGGGFKHFLFSPLPGEMIQFH